MRDDVKLGLCGFTIGAAAYFRQFAVVEVQQTFYDPPQDATLVRWRRQAPLRFDFTLKAWQLVTHDASSPTYRRLRRPLTAAQREEAGSFRATPTVDGAWQRTLGCARLLRSTAILLQCPRGFRPTDENVERMRAFAERAERPDGVRLRWQPRGEWPPDLVRELCEELELVHAVDPFVATTQTPDEIYFRLHGNTGAHHVYSDAELEELRGMLPPSPKTAHVLFNNIPRVGDAQRFRALLER